MDTSSLIMGLVLVSICIVPLYLFNLNRKNKKKRLLQALSNIAAQHNCTISQYDVCGENIIGMDEAKKYVFCFKKQNDEIQEHFVNLAEIKNCKTTHTTRNVKHNDEVQKVTEKVELSFIPINGSEPNINWEFFNEEVKSHMTGELQLVEKWTKLISAQLKSK